MIINRKTVFSTEWFDLIEKQVEGWKDPHYSFTTDDYICCVVLKENCLVLVEQYRPAVEAMTLELPGGHVDAGESPEQACRRELEEETGYRALSLEYLGGMWSDVGRNSNRNHCFFTNEIEHVAEPEQGVSVVEKPLSTLPELISTDRFNFGLHMAALYLAVQKGVMNG